MLDISSGRFTIQQPDSPETLQGELERLKPAELLLPEEFGSGIAGASARGVTRRPGWHFDFDTAIHLLTTHFGTRDLTGFGCGDMPLATCAAGALLQYVQETQQAALPHISGLAVERHDEAIIIDAATRRNLEIEQSSSGEAGHTLAGILDNTATVMGSRLLRRWLSRPLRDRAQVHARLDAIEELLGTGLFVALSEILRGIGDIERIIARIALRSARPRDLSVLREALGLAPDLHRLLDRTYRWLAEPGLDAGMGGYQPGQGVQAGPLPDEKARRVAALRGEKKSVSFVGDGVNDAPALSEADLGIAVEPDRWSWRAPAGRCC